MYLLEGKMLKKLKKMFSIDRTPTKSEKINFFLNTIIDNIEIKENDVIIKLNKNLLIMNDGHLVLHNSGYSVLYGKQIHLNPMVDINEFTNIEEHVQEANKKAVDLNRKFLQEQGERNENI
jgi:hypothetical protein